MASHGSAARILPRYNRCFLCGRDNPVGLNIHFKHEGEIVYTELEIDERYVGYRDRIHGGILAALLDETIGWACAVATKKIYYTAAITVRYRRPLSPGTRVRVSGRMVERRRQLAIATGRVAGLDGTIYATAQGKYLPLSREEADQVLAYLHKEDGSPVRLEDIGG